MADAPLTPEHELPFHAYGRDLVLLVYPPHDGYRPLVVAEGRGRYFAAAGQTARRVHVIDGDPRLARPIAALLAQHGFAPDSEV